MEKQPKLHRPWRAVVALVEVVLAAVAIWVAFPLWSMGVKTLTVTAGDGAVLTSTRYIGSWIAAAIGLGLVSALLLTDAVREVVLAVRARHRAKPRDDEPEGFFGGELDGLNEA